MLLHRAHVKPGRYTVRLRITVDGERTTFTRSVRIR